MSAHSIRGHALESAPRSFAAKIGTVAATSATIVPHLLVTRHAEVPVSTASLCAPPHLTQVSKRSAMTDTKKLLGREAMKGIRTHRKLPLNRQAGHSCIKACLALQGSPVCSSLVRELREATLATARALPLPRGATHGDHTWSSGTSAASSCRHSFISSLGAKVVYAFHLLSAYNSNSR